MRILLDENMPPEFGAALAGHEVQHVKSLGQKGIKNGALLKMCRTDFDVLITLDRGIFHQHNHAGQALVIILIRVRTGLKAEILSRAPDVAAALASVTPGTLMEI